MSPDFDITSVSPAELLLLVKKAGGQRAFARRYNIARSTLQDRLYKLRDDPFKHRPAPVATLVGQSNSVRRFILTSAQDSTVLHDDFLTNLEAYRDWLQQTGSCEIMVAGFTYNKQLFEDHSKHASLWPTRIQQYLVWDRIRIADRIDFCAEMNTLPTAENPLSGFHTYTRDRWGIFPHAKVQLVSVPTMKTAPPKQIMTTGACTLPNYVMKKAGIKASFHHVFGAVLVEIDKDGSFFCRHLIADDDGTFCDLDRHIVEGEVTTGHRLNALTPGDIHVAQIDEVLAKSAFGFYPDENRDWHSVPDSMIQMLRPDFAFIHDVCDFRTRNHHNIADPHDRFRLHITGTDSVEGELREVARFLDVLQQRNPDTNFVVVESNHDQALLRWLKTADYRHDPINARFFLQCQLASYAAIERREKDFSIFEHVAKYSMGFRNIHNVRFLREDESFVIGGVEHSNHGHRGPNGSRGSVASLVRVAPKMTIGHVHSPAIFDGLIASGTSSRLDMGYNAGSSSWAHTMVAQYRNGKRALITFQGPKWCVQ